MDSYPTWARWMIGVVAGCVLSVAGGCTALFVVGFDSLDEQNLPKVDTGVGRTSELDAALDFHGLSLPGDATNITYTTVSSWDADKLGVRFETSEEGLQDLLDSLDRRMSLRPGFNPWELYMPGQPEVYGWELPSETDRAALVVEEPRRGEDRYAVVVDEGAARPIVFLEGVNT